MNQIKSYKDLIVWQKSMDLVITGYQLLKRLPHSENFGLISQAQRSLVSVPSNIAEGYGRNSTKDYIRFLQIARGSLYELETQIEISKRLNYVSEVECEKIDLLSSEVGKMLSSLINKLRKD